MLNALQFSMPSKAIWTQPQGGFCTWLTLPPGQYGDLYHTALRHGVAFTPGDVFLTEPDGATHLRLCFGRYSPEEIHEGIATLGQLMRGCHPVGLRGESYAWPLV